MFQRIVGKHCKGLQGREGLLAPEDLHKVARDQKGFQCSERLGMQAENPLNDRE